MELHKIELENFKSFRDKHLFSFDADPGLHFVTGTNVAEPALGSNGIGKSSLFDAVYFALFGKTVRGLKPGDVVSWGEKNGSVNLSLTSRDVKIEIVRRRIGNRNSLVVNGKESDQTNLDQLIGLSESLFSAALIRGQFSEMFFDLAPAQQLSMMDDILELGVWTNASSAAKISAQERKMEVEDTKSSILRIEGNKEANDTSLTETLLRSENYEKNEASEIKILEINLNSSEDNLVKITAEEEQNKSLFNESALETAEAELSQIGPKLVAMERERSNFDNQIRNYETDERQWRERISHFDRLIEKATCPTCEQSIGAEHTDACLAIAKQEIETISEIKMGISSSLCTKDDEILRIGADLNVAKNKRESLCNERDIALRKTRGLESDRIRAEGEIINAKSRLNDRLDRENPHEADISRMIIMESTLKERIKSNVKILADQEREYEAVNYWVDGFKYVRLFVIDRALIALELEVNSNLVQLGLKDMLIRFATERTTKSGGLSHKFDVIVSKTSNPDQTTPLAAWSGGEYQRLRLACELGLANMILGSRGIKPKFEVWDEPTEHLSVEGVEDLMRFLRDRAISLGRQIWLIDHVARSFQFDSTTIIEKNVNGSKIIHQEIEEVK